MSFTRYQVIERIVRQVYGGQPTDDSNITSNLINNWMNDAIALAAKQNYRDNIQVDAVGYVNNSFYSTFSGIAISKDTTDNLCWMLTLPNLPVGIGRNMGVSEVRFADSNGFVSFAAIPVSIAQWAYMDGMRKIPNITMFLPEGNVVRLKTPLQMFSYTAIVKMVSGGDDTNLNSILNVPNDYVPIIIEYCAKQLMLERAQPKDLQNDGEDNV